jgi:hypothetical protein
MAIYALKASPKRPQTEIISNAIGEKDEYGNPFAVIRLTAVRKHANATSSHGYEDTIVNPTQNGFIISHRKPGRINWVKDVYGIKSRGMLAKTPHNMKTLASNYFDKVFIIDDPLVRAEVEAMANKNRKNMTPEQIAADEARIKGMHTSKYGGAMKKQRGKTTEDVVNDERERGLRKKEEELNQREAALKDKEAEVGSAIAAKVGEGASLTKYSEESVKEMKFPKLRSIAAGLKIKEYQKMNKPELEAAILAAQGATEQTETITE